jgi:hypothetical protein
MSKRKYVRKAPYKPWPIARRLESFWTNVQKGDGCWLWTGPKHGKGYGAFVITLHGQKLWRANRVSWVIANGRPIPDGLQVLHSCDVKACVNPDHLRAGTPHDNNVDQMERGQIARGERNRHAKLTAKDVLAIRASDESDGALARRYGVWPSTIHGIRVGKKWRHLPGARPYRPRARGKLTDEMRTTIRRRRWAGEPLKRIAADFGVTAGYVCVLATQDRGDKLE